MITLAYSSLAELQASFEPIPSALELTLQERQAAADANTFPVPFPACDAFIPPAHRWEIDDDGDAENGPNPNAHVYCDRCGEGM